MADISISKKHNLDKDILRTRLEELAQDLNKKYSVNYNWSQDTINLSGAGLKKGTVKMTDNEVSIEITLGMLAKMLKSKIENEINNKIVDLLS